MGNSLGQLPPYLQNFFYYPPEELLKYFRTGQLPSRTSTSEGGSTSNTTGFSNVKGLTTNQFINQPFITPDYAPLATKQRDILFNRLGGYTFGGEGDFGAPTSDNPLAGYKAEGLRNIGQTNAVAAKSLEDVLTQRGLGGKTAAGQDVLAGQQSAQNASFLNSLPLLQRDMQNQDLAMAGGAVSSFGTGQAGRSQGTNNSATNYGSNTVGTNFSSMTDPGGFDFQGMSSLFGQLMPYAQNKPGFFEQLLTNPSLWAMLAGL